MKNSQIKLFITIITYSTFIKCQNFSFIDLPTSHLSMYFNSYPDIRNKCEHSSECIYKDFLHSANYNKQSCWGYEPECREENRISSPICHQSQSKHSPSSWAGGNKKQNIQTFFYQADFGYIKQQISEMKIMCEPSFQTDSSLECSKYLRFCRGRNIFINLTDVAFRKEPIRYNIDVLKQGDIGGHCKLHKKRLLDETEHLGALQSWAPELRFFAEYSHSPIESGKCDIVITKPTFVMKIDATSNMYHHFCDFFNLYAALHVNSTHPTSFAKDVHILIWETYTYETAFGDAFKAFTDNEIWDLKTFQGHSVCFKNIVFPLLPRMIFGLYYNTPIIHGCEKSGLFRTFSEHILHRLQIPQLSRESKILKITFLARKSKYRRVINEDELIDRISENEQYFVRKVSFERVPFKKQLEIIRNTDILIGMHGAGLTHLLFLPSWASVFELYNCEDPNCYKDLARLKGVNYVTWEDETKVFPQHDEEQELKGGAHAKFTNYVFEKDEFSELVDKAANYVLNNDEFNKFFNTQDVTPLHEELYLLVFLFYTIFHYFLRRANILSIITSQILCKN